MIDMAVAIGIACGTFGIGAMIGHGNGYGKAQKRNYEKAYAKGYAAGVKNAINSHYGKRVVGLKSEKRVDPPLAG